MAWDGFERAHATGDVMEFKFRVAHNLQSLSDENGEREFSVPIAILFVIDEQNGGDATAREVIRRFGLLDVESRNVIDFFFLGWRLVNERPQFDLAEFNSCRRALRDAGVVRFGGNADLYVLDAWWRNGRVELDFQKAIHVDLAAAAAKRKIDTVGSFLQGLIDVTEAVRSSSPTGGSVIHISNRLGLAFAKQSFVEFVLNKWGGFVGANRLAEFVTQNVGSTVDLAKI
ncbi:MAG TPA: hypothetical protein VEC06_15840 [Paucimonas sp.]|nr:hypothetical protein [Paucimonas sp.]